MPFPLRFALQFVAAVAFVVLVAILLRHAYVWLEDQHTAQADLPSDAVMPASFASRSECDRFLAELAKEAIATDATRPENKLRAGCLHS